MATRVAKTLGDRPGRVLLCREVVPRLPSTPLKHSRAAFHLRLTIPDSRRSDSILNTEAVLGTMAGSKALIKHQLMVDMDRMHSAPTEDMVVAVAGTTKVGS